MSRIISSSAARLRYFLSSIRTSSLSCKAISKLQILWRPPSSERTKRSVMWTMLSFHVARETAQACGTSGGELMKKHMLLTSLKRKQLCDSRYLVVRSLTVRVIDTPFYTSGKAKKISLAMSRSEDRVSDKTFKKVDVSNLVQYRSSGRRVDMD